MSHHNIVMTQYEHDALRALLSKCKQRAKQQGGDKAESGAGQDGWHDEGFKYGMVMEAALNQRADEIEAVLAAAKIVHPHEQAQIIELGSGVALRSNGGEIERMVVVGYPLNIEGINAISYRSPVFSAIKGSRVGQTQEYRVGQNKFTVEIIEIVAPSEAFAWACENHGKEGESGDT